VPGMIHPLEIETRSAEIPTRALTLSGGAVIPAPPVGTSTSLPAAEGMMVPARIEFGEVHTPIRAPISSGGMLPPPMGATMTYRAGGPQGPTELPVATQDDGTSAPPTGTGTALRTGLEMTPQAISRLPGQVPTGGFSTLLRSSGRGPSGHMIPQDQIDRAGTPPLGEVLALAEALNGARDRSVFNTRMLSSLPQLKDVSGKLHKSG